LEPLEEDVLEESFSATLRSVSALTVRRFVFSYFCSRDVVLEDEPEDVPLVVDASASTTSFANVGLDFINSAFPAERRTSYNELSVDEDVELPEKAL